MTTHSPNTPRTHNAKGQRINEPVQCIYDLQAWPCEVASLAYENERLGADNAHLWRENERLRGEIAELREEVRCFEANIGAEGLDR